MRNTGADEHYTELQDWLCARLAEELRLPRGAVDPTEPMSAYGLDSIRAITLLTTIEDHVGFAIDPNALWEFPTVASLAESLVGQLATRSTQS
ncbi:acyl carrier protein [Streptomyces sp. NBC_01511]|uniref:acyl carrier protein n=1 Tax=unclassified Streptomyces TaxID=2593676 RepID=UPI00386BFD33